jgi:hypothetical protein
VGNGLSGALVLELQATYVSTVETFPLTFSNLGTTATNTLTIRPQTGATGLSISTAVNTVATVDLNGAQFLTLDGRPGGTGTAKQLTIANTNTINSGGVALRFINEASNNIVEYLTLQSGNLDQFTGTVFFSGTSGANGNDNNTIDHCDIRDGVGTPATAIYSEGSTGTVAQGNSGNTVSNCNIYNFDLNFLASNALGVWLNAAGNTGWTITGNSFYQTLSRTAASGTVGAIAIIEPSGNFTVTGNFIGGSAPGAGGTAWTTTGASSAYLFKGILLNVSTTTPSSVQGNTIKNIAWTSSSNASTQSGVWSGLHVQAGAVNIGTVTGNTIGSGTGTGSISVTTSGTGGTTFGIVSESSGVVAISNNTVGSITMTGTSTSVSTSLTGIKVSAGTNTISNNTVGSTTTANSLNATTLSTSATTQQVSGILGSGSTSASITGNTVANLNNNYSGTAFGLTQGLGTTSGTNTIIGNTIRNLATKSQNTSISVQGINQSSSAAGQQTVSQNVVHSLSNTAASSSVWIEGIFFVSNSTTGPNTVARNLVHSLAVSSTSSSSRLLGMNFASGSFTVQNNMVRVGIAANGTSTAGASSVKGISDGNNTEGRNFYNNSVYVGGTQTSGAANSYAFTSFGASNTRDFRNNIFVNARSNSGATSKHYAVNYGGTTMNPAGLTAGGNLLLASGTGGHLGLYNSVDGDTLTAWQTATGQDATSAVGDPLFVNPADIASAVDLHLQASNPTEGQGIAIAAVTDDFDGQTRSSLTPIDVGADAGNFTLSSDVFAPRISYPLLSNGSTANRVLTGWGTISDVVGVSSGASAPRLYFKKSTDADVFGVVNNSTGNGWKYVTATGNGPYSFMMDYSIINGGSVSNGDTIQYFVVAQDTTNNLGSSPVGATASANPPVQNINAKPGTGVNSFSIATLSGTVTVGTSGTYPSLSGAGGLFAALNANVLTGNLVVNIISDLTETGGVTLNELASDINYPPTPSTYTLTIQPNSATMRTISGTANAGLITLNGTDRVTIDGRFGGSGRYLTFRNTSIASTAGTILFQNDASNNTVRNCVVEGTGGNTLLGVIGFSSGTVTGNDNNLITNCQVRDLSTGSGVPWNLIGSTGSSSAVANSGNTVSNNELFNFNTYGIFINSTGNDSWMLSGNIIYEGTAAINPVVGISAQGGGTNVITGNSIYNLLTTRTLSYGILFSGTSTTTIARNRITALNVNAATTDVRGIYASGSTGSTLNVMNNQITLSPSASISTWLYGLYDSGATDSVVNAFSNSIVLGGSESGTRNSWASYRRAATAHTARNNLFLNFRTGGSGSYFAAGSEVTGGSFSLSNNVYAGTGATAANFMDLSTTGIPVLVSFATWQASTGDTASQAGIAGSGNYSTAMFVNASTGDLHLVPGGNLLVNGTGTPIAGVTDDYDGDSRPSNAPTIGSDEARLPGVTVTQTSAVADGGSIDFGTVTLTSSSTAKTFTITNPGTADLTSLALTKDGTNAGDFTVSTLSGTSVPIDSGSVTFTVTFNPSASGARSAAIHIASNVTGAKNPFDITLTGTGQSAFQAWAASNTVASDPTAPGSNGIKNLLNFAFSVNPSTGSSGALVYNGNFAGSGTIASTGQPTVMMDPATNGTEIRGLFVRRKDAAAAGLTYTPQFSADLSTWQDSASTPTVLADDGVNQIVSVPYPTLIGGFAARFFKMTVSLAP